MRELLALTGQFAAVDELLTGRENLEMFGRLFRLSREEARRRASELLERFELTDAADRSAKTYSGGMRRRLDLASSLLTQPRVLFLDEPTTGLDPRSRNEIWQIVRDLRREGPTILLTTPYLEEADQLADKIAVIDHGRVIAEGTGDELKDRVGGQILEVELTDVRQRPEAEAALIRVGCGPPENDERPNLLTARAAREPRPRRGSRRAATSRRDRRQRYGPAPTDAGRRLPAVDRRATERERQTEPRRSRPLREAHGAVSPPPACACPQPARRGGGRHRHRRRDDTEPRHSGGSPTFSYSRRSSRSCSSSCSSRFGGAVGLALPPGVSYVDYLLPGIRPVGDVPRPTPRSPPRTTPRRIDRFRSMPMARSAVLLGRTTADLVRNILIIVLMIVVGYLVGFRFQAGVIPALACIALVAAFGFALSWIFAFVSLVVRGAETAQTAGFVLLFPLVFASSVFVPISSMPSWLQPIAEASPVTLTADAARTLALTGGVPDSLWGSLAWIAGIVAVFVPLSVWRYRRMS